jgi:hypothetical protein
MILLTPNLRDRLLVNGRVPDADHVPVVKFFNPLGEGVWLATELDPDGDTLFGLADLGEPELDSFSLRLRRSACRSALESSVIYSSREWSQSRPGPRPRGRSCALRGC